MSVIIVLSQPLMFVNTCWNTPVSTALQSVSDINVESEGSKFTVVWTTVSQPFGLSRYSKKIPTSELSQVVFVFEILIAGKTVMVVVTMLSQSSTVFNMFS